MKIAPWNVNSVRQRIEHLLRYLRDAKPDVLCLQELKCVDEAFPHMEVEAEGYNAAVHGQKGFNGVAILAKAPVEAARGLPGDPDDEQARYAHFRPGHIAGRTARPHRDPYRDPSCQPASRHPPKAEPLTTQHLPRHPRRV